MEVTIKNFFKNLDVRFKTIFISVIVFLFLAHGMAIFNKFSFNDDITCLFNLGGSTNLGRWGLDVLEKFTKFFFSIKEKSAVEASAVYSMPLMSSFYIVIFLSISLYLMVKLLDIKSLLSCVVLSGLFMTSFFFTSLFAYMFTAVPYIFSLLLSVIAAYLISSYRKISTYLLGVFCMVF